MHIYFIPSTSEWKRMKEAYRHAFSETSMFQWDWKGKYATFLCHSSNHFSWTAYDMNAEKNINPFICVHHTVKLIRYYSFEVRKHSATDEHLKYIKHTLLILYVCVRQKCHMTTTLKSSLQIDLSLKIVTHNRLETRSSMSQKRSRVRAICHLSDKCSGLNAIFIHWHNIIFRHNSVVIVQMFTQKVTLHIYIITL